MENHDFNLMTQKLLKDLRGDASSKSMSELLKFNFDKYYRWENDYQKIHLDEFIGLFESLNYDLLSILNKSLLIKLEDVSQKHVLEALESEWGSPSYSMINKQLGFSKSKWWRIKSTESKLNLCDFFHVVHILTGRLSVLSINLLPSPKSYPLAEQYTDYENSLLSLLKNPEIAYLTSCFYLREYMDASEGNKNKVIASKLNISAEVVEKLLAELCEKNLIVKQNGNYTVKTFKTHLSEAESEVSRKMFSYLLSMSNSRQSLESSPEDLKNFKVAPVSMQAKSKIDQILKTSFKQISEVIDNDSPADRQVIISLIQNAFYS